MACPLSLDEAPLTASAIFATTEVMKEVCGNEPNGRGEKKGARAAGAEGVCDRQAAACGRREVMEAVTREMEEALRRGILIRGVRWCERQEGQGSVRRFFFGVALRAVGLQQFAEVCVLERDLNKHTQASEREGDDDDASVVDASEGGG